MLLLLLLVLMLRLLSFSRMPPLYSSFTSLTLGRPLGDHLPVAASD